MSLPRITIDHPPWLEREIDWALRLSTVHERMRWVIELVEEQVRRGTGGPFAAAVFEAESGALVGVGLNRVVPLNNCCLHAEVVAIMVAQARVGSYSLGRDGMPVHELVTSCDPCAMCVGAAFWSGVGRIVAGADRDDAMAQGFDEGPVFSETYAYLAERGVQVERGVCRDEAAAVLERYVRGGGEIYNA
ncbi:MAG TPA: nucleoside deaminase [Longimicrobiales bacterium]|nr:nucleoside deaminase [Longimicrobiales bacterium]